MDSSYLRGFRLLLLCLLPNDYFKVIAHKSDFRGSAANRCLQFLPVEIFELNYQCYVMFPILRTLSISTHTRTHQTHESLMDIVESQLFHMYHWFVQYILLDPCWVYRPLLWLLSGNWRESITHIDYKRDTLQTRSTTCAMSISTDYEMQSNGKRPAVLPTTRCRAMAKDLPSCSLLQFGLNIKNIKSCDIFCYYATCIQLRGK